MDRNKGIIWVIGCILVCGILITSFTSNMVKKQEESLAAQAERYEALQEEEGPVTVDASGIDVRLYDASGYEQESPEKMAKMADKETGTAAETPGVQKEEESQKAAEQEASAAEEGSMQSENENTEETQTAMGALPEGTPKSRMASGPQMAEEDGASKGPGEELAEGAGAAESSQVAQDYKQHCAELDSQMEALRNQAVNTYDMKTALENEWKLWDSELNNIYGIIKGNLPQDQVEALVKEERAWIVSRDAKAVEDAGEYAGGTMEGVEYMASMAGSTRERVYYLVEQYEKYLQ